MNRGTHGLPHNHFPHNHIPTNHITHITPTPSPNHSNHQHRSITICGYILEIDEIKIHRRLH